MTEPDDGTPDEPQLSRLYRQFSTNEPSNALDQHILAAAQAALGERSARAGGSGWRRWRTPAALATTLLLTAILALLQQRPPADLPAKSADDAARLPAAAKEAEFARATPGRDRPALADHPVEQAAPAGDAATRFASVPAAVPSASPPAARSRPEARRTPAVWLDEIRLLRRTGETREAERQLREFQRANPDHPLPEDFLQ
jgi:hypothetical protein